MSQALEDHAGALPGAWMVVQWMGAHVFKVGPGDKAKVFAIFADKTERVTLKCKDAETASFLIEIGAAEKAPHLPRGGWVAFSLNDTDEDDLRERIETSYDVVRATLTKAQQADLPPR
ncbi:MmcQ/YjbR family DNA-binding protein [Pontivivens ytuae]|uniref:MmcQ/YjbR family DNA-binding protein n=1 Tax=Pontivivens ytuae TaxID=2789856 RepID=A0A7S9LVA8_9RHOB|nr:MmcQ/YjbR family DNA-binding protein [Pontivivens ytuae]QPH55828.1 MmcQ/YjbR family DNA-binding protein [Pontivivens ytuae]